MQQGKKLFSYVTFLRTRSLQDSNSYIFTSPLDISELVRAEGHIIIIELKFII